MKIVAMLGAVQSRITRAWDWTGLGAAEPSKDYAVTSELGEPLLTATTREGAQEAARKMANAAGSTMVVTNVRTGRGRPVYPKSP